jgi:signal transduction histidine kinase/ActR/RegA family two-component response regulator
LIALTASAYSAADLWFAWPNASDEAVLIASRANYFMGALHAVAWQLYTFGGPTASAREMPRPAQILCAVLTITGLAILVTGAHAIPGQWHDVTVEWAGVSYHTPAVYAWAEYYALFVLASLAIPFLVCIPRARRGEPGAITHLIGFTVFFICMSAEVLVTNGVLSTLFLGDVGFLAVVIPVAAATVRRVVSDAQQLDSLSQKLAGEIEERTEALDRAQFALQESERHAALGRLAAGVGHEINNPLTYLSLSLESVEQWAARQDLPADVRESISNAREGSERIRLVVDGLRNYTRTTAGEFRVVSLAAIAQSALRVASHQVQHVARIETNLDMDSPVHGDEPRLVQVVVNLVTNAAQAIVEAKLAEREPKRDIVIAVRIAAAEPGFIALEVRDTGPGISDEDLRRLAEPYFTTRANAGGTGLGLFLSRGIIEQHGGRLEIESTVGEGTLARVVLPSAERRAADDSVVETEEPPAGPRPVRHTPPAMHAVRRKTDPQRTRVLLIDDEPLVARVMARTLSSQFDVSVAASATDALAIIDANPSGRGFDVVLCDIMMPGVTGIEFAEMLSERDPALRAHTLFLTGGAVTTEAVSFLEREDVQYLSKPVATKDLIAAIENLLKG